MTDRSARRHSGGSASPAFLDIEASGLGARSWPVEVGWASGDGLAEAFLIRPHDRWPAEAWEPAAEALHGLSRARLDADGLECAAVCDRLNGALRDRAVYSDAPDWDAFWLYRLFDAGRRRAAFAILDFGALMRPLALGREAALFAAADRLAPRRHRAAADARHLLTLYELAIGVRSLEA